MLKPSYLIGFTGHRQLDDEGAVRVAAALSLDRLRGHIEKNGGRMELYGSAALGADVVVCEEAEKLGIPLHLVLPKPVVFESDTAEVNPHEGFAADFWKDKSSFLAAEWQRTFRLIQKAQSGADGWTFRLVTGSQTEPECYYDLGLQILDVADALLAIWDGQTARGLGGTEQLVTLAKVRSLPLIVLPPKSGEPYMTNLEQLAKPNDTDRKILRRVDEYSRSYAATDHRGEETATQLFTRLEACSNKHADYFRKSLVRTIQWHGAATLVAAVAAVLPQTSLGWKIALAILAAVELMLVILAYLRNRRLRSQETHERWMDTRFAAELMRVYFHSAALLDPLHPLIARHQPEWRRFAITAALMVRRQILRPTTWQHARNVYVEHRLRDQDPKIGQIAYFVSKRASAEPHFRSTHRWGTMLGGAAIFFVIGALIFKLYVILAKHCLDGLVYLPYPSAVTEIYAGPISWLTAIAFSFLPIALPLAAGIFISLRVAMDSGRRTYRYRELAGRLTTVAATLETLKTESAVRRTVAATEEVLLDELIEWRLAEQQNGGH